MRLLLPASLLVALLAAGHGQAAPASPTPEDEAQAKKLFDEGARASDRGNQALACERFSQSLELARRGSTLLNLGVCETALGKLAAAHRHYSDGIALLPPGDPRLASAKERLDALDKRVAKLRVDLPADAPEGTRVKLDGATVVRTALGSLILDPGEHTIVLIAPGHDDTTATVTLAEGQHQALSPSLGKSLGSGSLNGASPESTPSAPSGAAEPSHTLRTVGFVAGGIGLAGALVAAITGGLIVSNDGTIKSECPDQRCSQDGLDAIDANKSLFVPNYIGWGVGIAGIGAGAALLIADAVTGDSSSGQEPAARAWLAPTPGGLALGVQARF